MTPTPPRNNSSPKDPTNKQTYSQGGANKQPSPSSDKENPSESLRLSPYQVPKGRVAHVKQVLENRKSAQGASQDVLEHRKSQGASSPDEKPGTQACTTPPTAEKTHSDANTKLEPTPEKPLSQSVNSKQLGEVEAKPEEVSKSVAEAIPAVEGSGKEEFRPTVIPPNDQSNPSEPISSTTSLNAIPTSRVTQLQPNKNKDFLTKFTAIETEEQKKEYKELYRKGLAMYREQYQVIDSYNLVSEQLAKKLKAAKAKEDLVKVEKVKEMVRKKYKEMQEDVRCQEALSNFQHLHEKLSHLRMLVERRQEEEKVEMVKRINNQPGDTMPIFA